MTGNIKANLNRPISMYLYEESDHEHNFNMYFFEIKA